MKLSTDWVLVVVKKRIHRATSNKRINWLKEKRRITQKTNGTIMKIHNNILVTFYIWFRIFGPIYIGRIQMTSAINCVIRIYAGYLFTIHWINSLLFVRCIALFFKLIQLLYYRKMDCNYKMFDFPLHWWCWHKFLRVLMFVH